ncbi:MAG: CehA/McbA family metallohydrolase [Planctomycetales bacterium]|nr:CehA/McbA family metallohydrolase [Planctomycetales bacterium]
MKNVEAQPLKASAKRIADALEIVGEPLTKEEKADLNKALEQKDDTEAVVAIQKVLDARCLAGVNINPESRVKVARGAAAGELVQQGWRVFLVKVHNEGGVTAKLRAGSPNAAPLYQRSSGSPAPKVSVKPTDVPDRWLDLQTYDAQPLNPSLSGLLLEYRILQLYSRDAGKGPYEVTYTRGPEYVIAKKTITVPADKEHAESFRLKRWIKLADHGWYSGDHHVHAAGCAHYEAPTEGITPQDMMLHILGEDLNIGCVLSWGPCWYHQKEFFEGAVHKLSTKDYVMRYDVEVSGFPSQHAGHLCLLRLKEDDYEYPKEAEFDWNFAGQSGHFKGTKTTFLGEWPTWDLPILKWGKEQGGVVGFSHSGWGLELPDYGPGGQRVPTRTGRAADKLPDYAMPPFNGIGANEYVVDVVHDVCDFISSVDTPSVWELNAWYHTLNCGYQCRISGETDFPCIYGDRVGLGRIYVKLEPKEQKQQLSFDDWVLGVKDGRSYCCDGLSHLADFTVNGLGVGEKGKDGRVSTLGIKSGEKLTIKVNSAALLTEDPNDPQSKNIRSQRLDAKPYWHVERARVGDSRKVPVELVVNGIAVEKKEIEADGHIEDLTFDYKPEFSSWVALRIFPACHTNPVFVEVDGKPIRASKKSAQWCKEAVSVCWQQKVKGTRESEKAAAKAAYDAASEAYAKILAEAQDDTK